MEGRMCAAVEGACGKLGNSCDDEEYVEAERASKQFGAYFFPREKKTG